MRQRTLINRRDAIGKMTAGAATMLAACQLGETTAPPFVNDGHLTARPQPAGALPPTGVHRLFVADSRDALLYVPPGLQPNEPVPLVVALHGDPGIADAAVNWFRGLADTLGFLLMAPSSREHTWDLILAAYDWDISRIDAALDATFSLCNVDPARIGLVGFSDGGTYALALGLSNGDLFRRIVSFAPGFLADVPRVGKPPLYIVHGTNDAVLTIDETRNVIVPRLRGDGYEVNYHEFAGGHVIPAALAPEALAWVISGATPSLLRKSVNPPTVGDRLETG